MTDRFVPPRWASQHAVDEIFAFAASTAHDLRATGATTETIESFRGLYFSKCADLFDRWGAHRARFRAVLSELDARPRCD